MDHFLTQSRQEDLLDLLSVAADHTHTLDDGWVQAPGSGCTEANPKLPPGGQGFNYRKQNVAEELIESYKSRPVREAGPGECGSVPRLYFRWEMEWCF